MPYYPSPTSSSSHPSPSVPTSDSLDFLILPPPPLSLQSSSDPPVFSNSPRPLTVSNGSFLMFPYVPILSHVCLVVCVLLRIVKFHATNLTPGPSGASSLATNLPKKGIVVTILLRAVSLSPRTPPSMNPCPIIHLRPPPHPILLRLCLPPIPLTSSSFHLLLSHFSLPPTLPLLRLRFPSPLSPLQLRSPCLLHLLQLHTPRVLHLVRPRSPSLLNLLRPLSLRPLHPLHLFPGACQKTGSKFPSAEAIGMPVNNVSKLLLLFLLIQWHFHPPHLLLLQSHVQSHVRLLLLPYLQCLTPPLLPPPPHTL